MKSMNGRPVFRVPARIISIYISFIYNKLNYIFPGHFRSWHIICLF